MQQFFGLDIGSRNIKVVELNRARDGRPELVAFGSTETPSGAMQSDSEMDQQKVAKAIKELMKESKIKSQKVITAFPESRVFTRVIEFPPLRGEELYRALEWESDRFIPLPKDKVKVSWMVLDEGQLPEGEEAGRKMEILLVAAPLDLVNRYLGILEMAGVEPVAFESEIIGMVRSLITGSDESAVALIISLGASATDLCIVDRGTIRFTRSIGTSGDDLAKAVSRDLGFEVAQAEEYKRAYGLMEDKLGGKILAVVKPVFDVIVNEIEKAIISYQTKVPMRPVKRVVLTGGTARLPGVVVYLAESLGIEVQIGDPWVNIVIPPRFEEEVRRLENQTQFAVAGGLALKQD
ncbi:type IV pilus assembly protein PilM [Patescibacteria group bacterium]|nr:type IV pilus assembly protein PilM [Patescibacteria group bacterium]MBU1868108.1 type IV pilus assembly protein PilM [Patescibacteria group bacterium]